MQFSEDFKSIYGNTAATLRHSIFYNRDLVNGHHNDVGYKALSVHEYCHAGMNGAWANWHNGPFNGRTWMDEALCVALEHEVYGDTEEGTRWMNQAKVEGDQEGIYGYGPWDDTTAIRGLSDNNRDPANYYRPAVLFRSHLLGEDNPHINVCGMLQPEPRERILADDSIGALKAYRHDGVQVFGSNWKLGYHWNNFQTRYFGLTYDPLIQQISDKAQMAFDPTPISDSGFKAGSIIFSGETVKSERPYQDERTLCYKVEPNGVFLNFDTVISFGQRKGDGTVLASDQYQYYPNFSSQGYGVFEVEELHEETDHIFFTVSSVEGYELFVSAGTVKVTRTPSPSKTNKFKNCFTCLHSPAGCDLE